MMSSPYPSYVDMDRFIDSGRLRGLDLYIRERLERRLASEEDTPFYTGPFTLRDGAPTRPGSRMVYLSRSHRAERYYDLDRTEQWTVSDEAAEFGELMAFIDRLPFAATGRMLIMYDPVGGAVTAHRDHDQTDVCHEFVWFRTNLRKPFYLLDPTSGESCHVAGYSAWFDTVNQYHGAEATGELAWSIRVDGRFTDGFRALMPAVADNPASRPARWSERLNSATPAATERETIP